VDTGLDQIDASTGLIIEKIDGWVDGFYFLLPNLVVAAILLLIFWFVALGAARLVERAGRRRGRHNLGEVGGTLLRWLVMILALMLAVTIVAPSISPADLFGFLGIGSVAIGFAFKDILQNMLAGILILIRQPFAVGDQIISGGHEGTVEGIETRATLIRTYDGVRVVIPNSDIYTDAVVVLTAFERRRSDYDVQIGSSDDWDEAREVMTRAALGCEGVLSDPAPEALAWEIADSGKNLRLRWWTDSKRSDVVHVRSRVICAVQKALTEAGIDLPYPTQVVLLHDQTEETDGDRSRQREGWPDSPRRKAPRPARELDRDRRRDAAE
jgi:small conductance mechanosensitive channel